MKRYLLAHHLKKFIFITFKQNILFWAYLSLKIIGCLNISILALIKHIFLLKVVTLQSSRILREIRSSLELRIKILFSFSIVVVIVILSQLFRWIKMKMTMIMTMKMEMYCGNY